MLATSTLAQGQNCAWTNDDDFILATTTDANAAAAMAEPGSGTEYVAGISTDGVTGHWVVRKRQSGTWSTVDDFIYSIGLFSHAESIARDSNGRIIVAGGANALNNAGHWLVRRSANGGTSWSTVDDFADPTTPASWANAATTVGNSVMVGGVHNESPQNWSHWIVRQSSNQAQTWTTISDVPGIMYGDSVLAMDTEPSGAVWAAGYNYDGTGYRWQVRRRSATGTTWTLVDDQSGGYAMWAATVVAPSNNTAYVAGYSWPSMSSAATWIVRKTTNGGQSWTVVDSFTNGTGNSCAARGATYSSQEHAIYIVGNCTSSASAGYHWVTRRSDNGGSTWTTDDDYQMVSGFESYPTGASATQASHIYVAGTATDSSHHKHWITRRRACNGNGNGNGGGGAALLNGNSITGHAFGRGRGN
ncbi:MAG: sialidase family protein [Myxococcaceae bacterium]